MGCRHSGFHVHAGPRILPRNAESMENLARYIIRASFAQDRTTYPPREAQVIYESRYGKRTKTFDALEWLAAMCSPVPNKGEQMVRYYGYYSNVCRGKRKAKGEEGSCAQNGPRRSFLTPANDRRASPLAYRPPPL